VATNGAPVPLRSGMSPRDRRRFLIALTVLLVLLFAGGMLAYVLDFRHRTVCPGGAQWISRTDNGVGLVTYVCPNGKTVTQGILP
jgi:hypothetical protein